MTCRCDRVGTWRGRSGSGDWGGGGNATFAANCVGREVALAAGAVVVLSLPPIMASLDERATAVVTAVVAALVGVAELGSLLQFLLIL
jgi:hypothetical protein